MPTLPAPPPGTGGSSTEEEDVEQLQITFLGLETQLNNTVRQLAIAYDMLKLTLGISIDSKLEVTDSLEDLAMQYYDLNLLTQSISPGNNIDFRIAEDQTNLARTEVKLEKSKALPRLSAYINYGTAGASNSFTFFTNYGFILFPDQVLVFNTIYFSMITSKPKNSSITF